MYKAYIMYIKSCSFHTQCSDDPSAQSLEHDLVPINKPDANTHNWVHQMYVTFSNLSQYFVKTSCSKKRTVVQGEN